MQQARKIDDLDRANRENGELRDKLKNLEKKMDSIYYLGREKQQPVYQPYQPLAVPQVPAIMQPVMPPAYPMLGGWPMGNLSMGSNFGLGAGFPASSRFY